MNIGNFIFGTFLYFVLFPRRGTVDATQISKVEKEKEKLISYYLRTAERKKKIINEAFHTSIPQLRYLRDPV